MKRILKAAVAPFLVMVCLPFAAGAQGVSFSDRLLSKLWQPREAEEMMCAEGRAVPHEAILGIVNAIFDRVAKGHTFALTSAFYGCLERGLVRPAPQERLKIGMLFPFRQDPAGQFEIFRRAAAEGSLDGLYRSAAAGLRGNRITGPEWRDIILEAARKGHRSAQREAAGRFLGFYRQGYPLEVWPKDGYQAIYWYSRLATESSVAHSCGTDPDRFQERCSEAMTMSEFKFLVGGLFQRDDLGMAIDPRASQMWLESAYDDGGTWRDSAGTVLYRMHLKGLLRDVSPERLRDYERLYADSQKRLIVH